ncbi:hypothetical protein AGMMS49992_12910 [Clostridia bacterium]|nr:hypothetical protein AGMMS49992_12910 [Clostridia bacterium]
MARQAKTMNVAEDSNPGGTDISFESCMESLESLVRRMETEQLTLEQSMAVYAEGMRLARSLDDQLNRTEKALVELTLDFDSATTLAKEG